MNNLYYKYMGYIALSLLIVATSMLLHSYDDRLSSSRRYNTEFSQKEISIDKDSYVRRQTANSETFSKNDITNFDNKDSAKNNESIVKNLSQRDPRTYYIDLDADYYRRREFDISLENMVYRNKIPQKELIDGSYLMYSFYKVVRDDLGRLSKIESYGTYYTLLNFQDFEYCKGGNLERIVTYDNMVNILAEELREYDLRGRLIRSFIDDKANNLRKSFMYVYDGDTRNEEIRIENRFEEVFEFRYSFYNPRISDMLIRREYYRFGRLAETFLYDYYHGHIHQKSVYNSSGDYVRTYLFREAEKADSIIKSTLPGFID